MSHRSFGQEGWQQTLIDPLLVGVCRSRRYAQRQGGCRRPVERMMYMVARCVGCSAVAQRGWM